MAALTASCWTVVPLPTRRVTGRGHPPEHYGVIVGKQRRRRVRLDLDNAGTDLTYPSSGGIPLPSFRATTPAGDSSYGMRRNIDYLIPYGEKFTATGLRTDDAMWKYDETAHSMHMFILPSGLATHEGHIEAPTLWTATQSLMPHSLFFEVIGW